MVPGLTSLEESKDLDRSVWLRTRRFPSLSLGFLTWRMGLVIVERSGHSGSGVWQYSPNKHSWHLPGAGLGAQWWV